MTLWYGNVFRIAGHVLGESVGHRLIPPQGARCEPEQVVKQFVKLLVFRDAMAPMPRHCNEKKYMESV